MLIQSDLLKPIESIRHGFATRQGGVSQGVFDSLNVSWKSGDDPENIAENRRRVALKLCGDERPLISAKQTHSTIVHHVTAAWPHGSGPEGDGLVTNRPGLILAVLTSDCLPVLFVDPEVGAIGVAHAGWGGAFNGVLQNTVTALKSLGAKSENIHAVIGPAIQQKSYEVGPEFFKRFITADPNNAEYFIDGKRPDHYQFNLPAYGAAQLRQAGVGHVEIIDEDTYSQPDKFFSYRRMCHDGDSQFGGGVSVIMLEDQ